AFCGGHDFVSHTTPLHRGMLDQQRVLHFTSGAGLGLADHFYQQMLQNHGGGMKPPAESSSSESMGQLAEAVSHKSPAQAGAGITDGDDSLTNWINDFIRMSDNSNVLSVLTSDEQPKADDQA